MTAPNGKHEFEAAKIFFEERLKDYLKQDKSLAVQDKPDGLVHPIYMGRRVETYYRAAIAALSNLAEENEGAEIVMKAMMIEIDNLKEEAEQGKALIADLTRDMNEYHDKAEKAEATLAKWRPVIEAVEKAGVYDSEAPNGHDCIEFGAADEHEIIGEALALRSKEKP